MGKRITFRAESGERLTTALTARVPGLSRSGASRLVAGKNARVDGVRVSSDVRLAGGEKVDAFVPDSLVQAAPSVRVVYADDDVVVADKPAGVESERALPALLAGRYGELYPVHRLDTNTTGLIVLARNEGAKSELERAFRAREIKKVYVATVVGRLPAESGVMHGWLVKDEKRGVVKAYDAPVAGGLEAVTEYVRLSYVDGLTEVELHPLTGRTHQLRVQLAHLGCPILGDGKYGDFAENRRRGVTRQRLRAVGLTLGNMGGPLAGLSGKTFHTELTNEGQE